jgi:hypothetical protein
MKELMNEQSDNTELFPDSLPLLKSALANSSVWNIPYLLQDPG